MSALPLRHLCILLVTAALAGAQDQRTFIVSGAPSHVVKQAVQPLGWELTGELVGLDVSRVSGPSCTSAGVATALRLVATSVAVPGSFSISGPSSVPTINPNGAAEITGQPALGGLATLANPNASSGPWTLGAPVTVAVIDTGIEHAHSLFAGRIHPASRDFLQPGTLPEETCNRIDDDGDGLVDEAFGHGTHIAGVVAAGCPEASIMVLRAVDDEGRGSAWDVAEAIVHAALHGADVINLSLQLASESVAVNAAIDLADALGVVVVASAGNDGRDTPVAPATHPRVLVIAATDLGAAATPSPIQLHPFETIAPFSNWGFVDFAAIGVDVTSAYPGDTWALWSGTSAAAAVASTTIAMMVSRNQALTPDGVRTLLASTAVQLTVEPNLGPTPLGDGRIFPFFAVLFAYLSA